MRNDGTAGSLTLALGPANGQEQTTVNFDAGANDLEAALEAMALISDVSVALATDGTGWVVTLNEPSQMDTSEIQIVANHLLTGQAGNADLAAAALAADPVTAGSRRRCRRKSNAAARTNHRVVAEPAQDSDRV